MNDFELASRRTAACLVLVESAVRYGKAGLVDRAYKTLHTLQDEYAKCAPKVHDWNDQLASQSDSPVERGQYCWSSAHEAAIAIGRMMLERLYWPAVSDVDWETHDVNAPYALKRDQVTEPAEQWRRAERLLAERLEEFSFEPMWIARLQERIARERAKLSASNREPSTPAQDAHRLIVDLEKLTVTLDGKSYDVASENALRWLKVLSEHPGEWISGPELKQFDELLVGVRTDRCKLPPAIDSLIDSETGKGSRLRL